MFGFFLVWNFPMILYRHDSRFKIRPLHLQPASESWIPREFRRAVRAIKSVELERDVEKLDGQQQWIHCTVDWDRLAQVFDLKSPIMSD